MSPSSLPSYYAHCKYALLPSIFAISCCIIAAMREWDDLRIFLALVRKGSVRAAAESLGVDNSTVSRRIRAFEQKLGVRLFERLPTGYTPTSAGEDMLDSAQQVEEEILALERRLLGQDTRLTGELRVTMPDLLAMKLLMPDLAAFTQTYPGIGLEINVSYEHLDLTKREADVAIRLTDNVPEHLVGERLLQQATAAYASTTYLAKHNLADAPADDLASLTWLGWDDQMTYPKWVKESNFPTVPVRHRLNNAVLQLEAVKVGIGIGVLPCFIGDQEPSLRRLPPGRPKLGKHIWLLTHPDLSNTTRVQTFLDFMASAITARRDLIEGHCPQPPTPQTRRKARAPGT
jgi:DNA-binding transcriptional LysR family regulator